MTTYRFKSASIQFNMDSLARSLAKRAQAIRPELPVATSEDWTATAFMASIPLSI
jgi:hypothetical protein